MKHEDSKARGAGFEVSVNTLAFWKNKTATLIHALMLVLVSLGVLLPALGSAQTVDYDAWQETIKNTYPSGLGCFQAFYPDTQWQQVPCVQPETIEPPPPLEQPDLSLLSPTGSGRYAMTVGNGNNDYVATASGGPVSSAEGSFPNVSGGLALSNWSLQLNTNTFQLTDSAGLCGGNSCTGWVEFSYQIYNNGANEAAYIWYVLIDAQKCPAGWTTYQSMPGQCFFPTAGLTRLGGFGGRSGISFLGNIKLGGRTANGVDTIILTVGGTAYSNSTSSVLKEFAKNWQTTQFNIFGNGDAGSTLFTSGSKLAVKLGINNGTTNAPVCNQGNFTSDTSNLYLNSPCCPSGGAAPAIAYAESTTSGMTTSCASLGVPNSYTVTASADSNGSISPSGNTTATSGSSLSFKLTPATGYKLGSVGGSCGGTLSGNTYTTKPITADCTVVASFTSNVSVTSSAGAGGSISPSGATAVNYGAKQTYTLTPNAGYSISSVGGTCGGTLSGNQYITNAITSNCTVVASFAQVSYTVTSKVNGVGGSISPLGSATVSGGTAKTYTITPNSGYRITTPIGGTCGGTLNGNTYTTNPVTANCTVEAAFTLAANATITASADAGGTISPSGNVQVSVGGIQTFTVTPNAGYSIASVGGTCGGVLSGNTYTTSPIYSNCTVVVSTGGGGATGWLWGLGLWVLGTAALWQRRRKAAMPLSRS